MGTYWLVTLKIQISDWQPQGYIQPPPPPSWVTLLAPGQAIVCMQG